MKNVLSFFRKSISELKKKITNDYIKNIDDDRMVVFMGQAALNHAQ